MTLSHLLSLSLGAVSVIAAAFPSQHILNAPYTQTGVLRRFQASSSYPIEYMLQLAHEHDLDIWQVGKTYVDVYFPHNDDEYEELSSSSSATVPRSLSEIENTILSHIPIQDPFETPRPLQTDWNLHSLSNSTFHEVYHPLYEIDAFINELVALRPGIVRKVNLGHSGEGREMVGISISLDHDIVPTPEDEIEDEIVRKKYPMRRRKGRGKGKDHDVEQLPKLGIVVMGAQHAREWVATASALHLAHALVSNTSEPHVISKVLQHFEFHIIPVPNPDGYSYTWETDRYWYKNRQKLGPSSQCLGLDMNRNWGYKWESNPLDTTSPISPNSAEDDELRPKEEADPCSHWFPGHRPFEASEVNNIANYVNTLPNLIGFIDLRSYGQMVSSPYSYSCSRMPKDAENQIEAAIGVVNALRHTHGIPYVTGRLCENLYRAPGNIVDWMYARAKVKYSYAVHLRDTGTYGFSLPAEWIRPVAEETGAMIHYLAKFIAKQLKRYPEL